MKTILAAKDNIVKLWGRPQPKDTDYRLMKYLLRVEVEDGILLHNVVTGHLIHLTPEEAKALDHLPSRLTASMQELISDHFLVPLDFDEYRSVRQLRTIFQMQDRGDWINHYVILPTTFCNAHCFYCYESDYPRVHMTEETANKLIDFIDNHRKGKYIMINWFGGEPLVGMDRIDQICQGLKDRDIKYTSSMISNGYLFDKEVVEKAVNLWKLERVQITLDGTEDTYNRVKSYANVSDNPFQRVISNIDILSSKKVLVNIRLNVDYYNKDDIRDLIEELGKRYSDNQYVTVYLSMLFNDQGYEPVKHSYDDTIALMDINSDYTERLKELNVAFDNLKNLHLMATQCMADNPHSIMIQPDGSFCRCEHENVHDSYGSIENGILDPKKLSVWKETVELSSECPDCALYPACYHLKKCVNNDLPCNEKFRVNSQKKQSERVLFMYVRNREGEKRDGV